MAGARDPGFVDDRHNNRLVPCGQSVGGCVFGKRGKEDSSCIVESCSICLELVVDDGSRSTAKLQCGHQFHLDCIGSAFNMKGAMQCPNCRNVEKGMWMYDNGSTRPHPEFVMEDWTHEEDLYGLSYPEMHYRVHWCPFGEVPQPASFEEVDTATTTYHNEFHRHHHSAAAVNHSYLAYVGPAPAATPRANDNSNNTDEHPWNNSLSNEHFHQLAVAPQYPHHPPSFSPPGAHVVDSDFVSPAARDISYPHPFLFSYRSNNNPRTTPAVQAQQGSNLHTQQQLFNHHHAAAPNLSSLLVPVPRRGLPPQPPQMPDQNVGFFMYPPPSSSGGHHEPETDQFHGWERDWFPHFPAPSNHRTISSFWHRYF